MLLDRTIDRIGGAAVDANERPPEDLSTEELRPRVQRKIQRNRLLFWVSFFTGGIGARVVEKRYF